MATVVDELSQFSDQAPETAAEPAATAKKAKRGKKKVAEPKPKRDNLSYTKGLTTISSLRRTLSIANAKKAKSAGRPEAIARYEVEIQTAKECLAAKLAECLTIEDLIKADEEPNRVISRFMSDMDASFKAWLAENGYPDPKNALKDFPQDIPDSFYAALPLQFHEMLVSRHEKLDYQLWAICRAYNFKQAVVDSKIYVVDGKWMTETQRQAAATREEERQAKKEAEKEAKAAEKAKKDAEKEAKAAEKAAAKAEKEAAKAAQAAEAPEAQEASE